MTLIVVILACLNLLTIIQRCWLYVSSNLRCVRVGSMNPVDSSSRTIWHIDTNASGVENMARILVG